MRKNDCATCPHLFKVDRNSRVVFCDGRIGQIIDHYQNKRAVRDELKKRNIRCPLKGGVLPAVNKKEFRDATTKDKKINKKRLRDYKEPAAYYFLLNYYCNNNCRFCSMGSDRNNPSPSRERLLEIIPTIKQERVVLFGGEPSLNPYLEEIIDLLAARGKKISMTTNARKFSSVAFAKNILSRDINLVTFSLISTRKKDHEYLTRTASYEEAMAGIKNISRFRRPQTGFRANIVPNKVNYKYVREMAEFAVKQGVGRIRINLLFVSEENARNNVVIEPKKTVPYIIEAMDYLKDTIIHWYIDNYPLCYFPHQYWKFLPKKRLHLEMHSNRQQGLRDGYVKTTLTEKCIDCSLKLYCPGLYHSSVNYWGDAIKNTLSPFSRLDGIKKKHELGITSEKPL